MLQEQRRLLLSTPRWFPVAGTVLAVAGALWLLGRNRTAGVTLGMWFAVSWGTFILFYAGGYHYGASSRYGVVSCAPVAIFMGIGFAALFGVMRRQPILFYGAAACGLVNWVAAMHYVPTLSREAVEAQADVDFVTKIAPTLPGGSVVLTPDPSIWMLQGINASQYFVLNSMVHEHLRELANAVLRAASTCTGVSGTTPSRCSPRNRPGFSWKPTPP